MSPPRRPSLASHAEMVPTEVIGRRFYDEREGTDYETMLWRETDRDLAREPEWKRPKDSWRRPDRRQP